jgi:hypothetical protein
VSPVSELRRLIVNWPFGTRRLVKSHKRVFVPSEHRRVLVQRVRSWSLAGLLGSAALFQPGAVAEPVAVRHMEGTVHGFLVLRTVEGKALAAGDLTQVVQGDRLVSRLISYQVIAAHFLPVRRPSSIPETPDDDSVVLSEIAHIVARKTDGPRGHDPLPLDERDRFENLILLCEEHHHVVDSQPQFYSVARLTQFKHDHEDHIARTLERSKALVSPVRQQIKETLHSTLLPVERMPHYVYGVPVSFREGQEKQIGERISRPTGTRVMTPFFLREGKLYTLQNLRNPDGPFRACVSDPQKVTRAES